VVFEFRGVLAFRKVTILNRLGNASATPLFRIVILPIIFFFKTQKVLFAKIDIVKKYLSLNPGLGSEPKLIVTCFLVMLVVIVLI
jgi:hypothetical protein